MYPFQHELEDALYTDHVVPEKRIETGHAVWKYLIRLPTYAPLLQIFIWKLLVRMEHTSQVLAADVCKTVAQVNRHE